MTPEFMIRPRVGIVAPNKNAVERFDKALGEHASTLSIAVDEVEGGNDEIIRSLLTTATVEKILIELQALNKEVTLQKLDRDVTLQRLDREIIIRRLN